MFFYLCHIEKTIFPPQTLKHNLHLVDEMFINIKIKFHSKTPQAFNANEMHFDVACSVLMVVFYLTDIERQRENTFNAI